jgi:hypothetical protein
MAHPSIIFHMDGKENAHALNLNWSLRQFFSKFFFAEFAAERTCGVSLLWILGRVFVVNCVQPAIIVDTILWVHHGHMWTFITVTRKYVAGYTQSLMYNILWQNYAKDRMIGLRESSVACMIKILDGNWKKKLTNITRICWLWTRDYHRSFWCWLDRMHVRSQELFIFKKNLNTTATAKIFHM